MEDFFRELEDCLRGEVSEAELADSMNYYRQYFREQRAAGVSEEEIIRSLGSPRLIARSIIDAHEAQEESGEYYDSGQNSYYGSDQDGYYDVGRGSTVARKRTVAMCERRAACSGASLSLSWCFCSSVWSLKYCCR